MDWVSVHEQDYDERSIKKTTLRGYLISQNKNSTDVLFCQEVEWDEKWIGVLQGFVAIATVLLEIRHTKPECLGLCRRWPNKQHRDQAIEWLPTSKTIVLFPRSRN